MQARRLTSWSVALVSTIALVGCSSLDLPTFFDKDEARRQNVREAIKGEDGHSRLIGDYIKIADSTLGYIQVEGVGLVTRLDNTGEDPPASPYRTMLLDDMQRHEFENPQELLHSPDTALVIVTAKIPPIVKKGDQIDVEIRLPDGSEASSLAGGWLMPCHLTEHAFLGGQIRSGKDLVVAHGAILVDALSEENNSPVGQMKGRIAAGGKYVGDDRNLTVAIRSDYRTVRMSVQIANRIGRRFHDYDEYGSQRKLADAKSHAHLELIVHERYRENYSRYLQCIRHMTLSESPVEKHLRLQKLSEEIKFGPTSEKAALQLEAIGPSAIPVLKTGLKSPQLEARFHAGCALAYLGNADGVPALQEAADKEPAFRSYSLAALAALDDGNAARALTELMSHESTETRYGAFRALSTMAPHDPTVQGIEMDGDFKLHPMATTGEPLVHLTRFGRAEIVVFGADQRFKAPMFVRAGQNIMVQASPKGDTVSVKRIAAGEATREQVVSTRVTEVIKAVSELGATYPDVVQMLVQADRQHNLPGALAVDKLPMPGRVYERPMSEYESGLNDSTSIQIGGEAQVPNLFQATPVDIQVESQPPPTSKIPTGGESTDLYLN